MVVFRNLSYFIADYQFMANQYYTEEHVVESLYQALQEQGLNNSSGYGEDVFVYVLPALNACEGKLVSFIFYAQEDEGCFLYSGWSQRE
ncbi:hypothetical protein [Listeria booriae]|uniref:hypothetical protein n=1 Tax=Listeria booriae TaxID=1552123 RepID=UPI001626F40F|nr:hypothetical protein [Listeria booriae]MBC1502408.1 hypothetical protein [Listeria booriae]